MPAETYETLPSSVLAWKKANKLGRFDPHAAENEQQRLARMEEFVFPSLFSDVSTLHLM
jgi:tubulin-specific chaperone B